jgi:hypothetical protein
MGISRVTDEELKRLLELLTKALATDEVPPELVIKLQTLLSEYHARNI